MAVPQATPITLFRSSLISHPILVEASGLDLLCLVLQAKTCLLFPSFCVKKEEFIVFRYWVYRYKLQ